MVRLLVLHQWDVNLRPASGRWQRRPSSAIAKPFTRSALVTFTSRTSEHRVVQQKGRGEGGVKTKTKMIELVLVAHWCASGLPFRSCGFLEKRKGATKI